MKTNYLYKKLTALLVGGAVAAGSYAVVLTVHANDQQSKAKSIGLIVDDRPLAHDVKLSTSFAPIVKKVSPSVVKVEVKIPGKEETQQGMDMPDNPFFRQFFGNQFSGPRKMYTPPEHGVGSGVIVTKDGYILTNNHVVDDADEVKVTLSDGREYTAKVVGKDPKSDLAVIKINATDLPAIAFAESSKAEVGDVVLAIGNPYAIGETVTMGIISAEGRATMGLDYEDFIQTDAAINPGNSGGALVDADGRLIGINTAIYSRGGGNQGIGFAIPTDLAKGIMLSLIEYGKVTRGYLGVMIQDVTPPLAKEFDLKSDKGALVSDVVPHGPADKAGLKDGDVILSFNGEKVSDSRHLKLEVASLAPGEKVPVEILRDGSRKTLEVKLKELPGEEQMAKNSSGGNAGQDQGSLQGVGVANLDTQARQQYNVPENVKGAVVTDVAQDSASAEAGLKAGDVIMEINHHAVASADDAVKLTEHSSNNKLTLLRVWSDGGSHYVVVDESNKVG
ncbi:MAG TPA: DegQ family serine endoprotease [Verrucomicrobiae bacterium]|jgi:serine protease Do|nr:DegQ family serine endoprotease [Verrucomicrobiae bacterium]